VTRTEAEDFLFHEAALLDAWKLDEWLKLLTDDARYLVPSNDVQGGEPGQTLYLIADDHARIKGRVARLKDPMAHAEFPHSRTRRLLANVRVESVGGEFNVHANFIVHRFRRGGQAGQFVGRYNYRIRIVEGQPRIAVREAILDAEELGALGAVSFIL
jgi:p-cumate 2,3-dioxygenase subunit beta